MRVHTHWNFNNSLPESRRARYGFSGFGQAGVPGFITFALQNTIETPLDDQVLAPLWGNYAVSNSGDALIRFGWMVGNGAYYKPFPDAQMYFYILPYYGPDAGQVSFISEGDFRQKYKIVDPNKAAILEPMIPLVSDIKSDVTEATYVQAIIDGIEFANQALGEAQRGNVPTALIRLNTSGAGAKRSMEQADIELRTLYGLKFLSKDRVDDLKKNLNDILQTTISDTDHAITTQKSGGFIASLWDNLKAWAQNVSIQLKDFAQSQYDKMVQAYTLALKTLKDEQDSLAILKSYDLTPTEQSLVNTIQDGVSKMQVKIAAIETQLQGLGVNVQGIRAQAGLGQPQVAIPAAVVGAAAVGTLAKLKEMVVMGFVMTVVSMILEVIYSRVTALTEEEEIAKQYRMQMGIQKMLDANKPQSPQEKAFDKLKLNRDAIGREADTIKGYGALSNDPVLKSKGTSAQDLLKKTDDFLASNGIYVGVQSYTPYIIGGGLIFLGVYAYFKNKD
jgi:hypothetical protein